MDEMKDILNFPERVNTGNGYANDLTATTNDRLERTVKALVLLSSTYQKESEKVRDTVSKLETTIKELDNKNGKLQIAIFVLTIVTVITAIVQVWLAFKG
jgi:ABC-type transporter Mla subunit MlaD